MAEAKGTSDDVRTLGDDIASAQEREVDQMSELLAEGGKSPGVPAPPAVAQMRNESQMAELEAAKGEEFDRKFLEFMTGHHLSAVQMTGLELPGGQSRKVKDVAKKIQSAQLAEAEQMLTLLDGIK